MSLLLDTHVVLWWLTDNPALPEEVKKQLDQPPISTSVPPRYWEVALKQSIGKIIEPPDLPKIIKEAGLQHLSITADHVVVAGRLPLIHRDPFDHMLITQARCEGLTLTTHDPQIHRYDVDLLRI